MKVAVSAPSLETHHQEKASTSATSIQTLLWKNVQQIIIALYDAYLKVQIYNRGAYSIEHLHDFDQHCLTASSWEVLWYCLIVTFPGLVLEIIIELVPLNSPLDPWNHNVVFWIRHFVSTAIISYSFAYQVLFFVPNVQIHPAKLILIAITTGMFALGANLVLAAYWTFPIPFTAVVTSVPFAAVHTPLLYLLMKTEGYNGSPLQTHALKAQCLVISLHVTMLVVYNGYNAIFQVLSQTDQVFFISVLPLLKFGLKNLYAWAMSSELESIPELTTFTVEVFHALFVSICMRTAKSMWASVIFIGIDAIQALLSVLEMESVSKALIQALKNHDRTSSPDGDLLFSVLALCQNPQTRERIRTLGGRKSFQMTHTKATLGPLPFNIDAVVDKTFDVHGNCKENATQKPTSPSKIPVAEVQQTNPGSNSFIAKMKIKPIAPIAEPKFDPQGHVHPESEEVKLVSEALKLLFHAEYCMMIELVEVTIPIVYVVHTMVIFYLPNAIYFPHTSHMAFGELRSRALNILLYALMEVVTLLAFHYMLKRRFKFSPMHLLGYSLKIQWRQIMARGTVTVWFVLQFTLMHYGVDFTLKFDWAEQLGINHTEGT